MKPINNIPPQLLQTAKEHLVLLQSQNPKKKLDTVQINVSGYADIMYLIADLTKVCMLALEGETSSTRIPEPATNICGVLGLILDLIPYEEADLLDLIRESVLNPREKEENFILENLYLTAPTGIVTN